MLINNKKSEIFCFYCNKWYNIHLIFLDTIYCGSVTCDYEHLIGNQSDKQWKEYWGEKDEQAD
jgi:hypothetical protein